MRVRILYHDHCFDGAASAALFTRFMEGRFYPDAAFLYTGMIHQANQTFDPGLFDGDENAIVDFKYASDASLTWWFDHHQSAFLTPSDAEHFRADRSGRKLYDPSYKSCTEFIRDVARDRFGFHAADMEDLVHWATIIDGAQYADAKTAVELGAPAMKLTLIIEGSKGSGMVQRIINMMTRLKLDQIVREPEVLEAFGPLHDRHLASIDMIRKESRPDGSVLFFDLSGHEIEGYNKFIPYYLFPDSVYTVSILSTPVRTKISVGSNPWTPKDPLHNLASICERYGGGGHPRVGAISLKAGEVEAARKICAEITAELKS